MSVRPGTARLRVRPIVLGATLKWLRRTSHSLECFAQVSRLTRGLLLVRLVFANASVTLTAKLHNLWMQRL